ncbi:MAG: hypothetical protein ABI180_01815 [Microcoleus sp.]
MQINRLTIWAGECSNKLSEVATIIGWGAIVFVDEPPVGTGFANALVHLHPLLLKPAKSPAAQAASGFAGETVRSDTSPFEI